MNPFKIIVLALLLLPFSCKKATIEPPVEPPVEPPIEEDCTYQFPDNLADIYGAWEPKEVINLEDGDTTYYDVGEGDGGLFLNGYYCDAYELRPDSNLTLYYVNWGRACSTRVDLKWNMENDTIYVVHLNGTLHHKLPIYAISETLLVVEDRINYKLSRATMRKTSR